jgi:tetratricopeptide (TPR) repeat protein
LKQRDNQNPLQSITPQRMRAFRIIAISIPIIFFALLEFSLWLLHYGPDLSLFKTETVNGKLYYTLNPSIKNRYFNRINFNPDPSPEFFLVSKPSGTFRIFVLGESTTAGYPYWYNGAFSCFLRDRLKTIFPEHSIEVINLGITATNSYSVLDISKDLMSYSPDLLIVYDGHNEFYGVLGAASNDRVAPARWITNLYLRMIHLRTFQLAKKSIAELLSLFGKNTVDYSSRTTMMEQVARGKTIPIDSDLYKKGFSIFRENLEELAGCCKDHNIPLILSTQVSNIRDQSPFISNNSANIPDQQLIQFQKLLKSGLEFQTKNNLDSAMASFRAAIALDTLYAEAHYHLAQCLETKGKKQAAYLEYILARDYDQLRFRTDSKFNNLIRSLDDDKQIFVADIEKGFKALSVDSLIGNNLILEHLHPNARGHFFIAKEYARLMRKHNLLAPSEEWEKKDSTRDELLWANRHVTNLDEFIATRKAELLTSGWPFRKQTSDVPIIQETDTLRFIAEQAVRNQIGWDNAHSRAAEYYTMHGDILNAGKEYETIISQFPYDVDSYINLAKFYFGHKEFYRSETILLASLQIRQTSFAYRVLGDISMKQRKPEKAIPFYEELNKLPVDPNVYPENAYMLAAAYLFSNKKESAVRVLGQIIDRYPEYKPANEMISRIKGSNRTHPAK